ncbi:MAG: VTT domain-containing protein [Candidatus Jorgensenbacteria bacterium]
MEELILKIAPFVKEYGVVGVFLLSFIEEIIAPVPSSVVLMAAGFFLLPALGAMKEVFLDGFLRIVLPASLGLTLGALLIYSLAYLWGEPLIKSWGKWFGVSWGAVEKWRTRFIKGYGDELLVFGLRAFPIVPNILISAVCGVVRYPTKSFIALTFLGSLVRAFLMSMVGWSVGEAYLAYAARISEVSGYLVGGIGLFVVLAVAAVLIRRWGKRVIL